MMIRPATRSDAPHMCIFMDIAGNGFACAIWQDIANPGQSSLEIGRSRAIRDRGDFSWHNTHILEIDGEPVGMVMGFRVPTPYDPPDLTKLHRAARPLVELEGLAAGTWYINAIAIYPEYRGKGHGKKLISKAEALARNAEASRLSLIVVSANEGACAFYRKLGFTEGGRRPFVPFSDWGKGSDCILMFKELTQ